MFARVIYAVNWYNFAAIFAMVARDMNQNITGLGIAVGSFYFGVGLFQVPGGLLAAKIGPKRTSVLGTTLASAAAMLMCVATSFSQLIVLRFFVGVGMAFVFAPAVILVARYFRERAEGFSVGLFNAALYLGGALGVFVWAVLADAWGWRESLALSGGLGLFTVVLMLRFIPQDSIRENFAMDLTEIRKILANRWLFLLSMGLFGANGFSTLVTAFMVFYLERSESLSATLAGGVGALALLGSLISSPLFGMLHDRIHQPSRLVFLCGLLGIVGLEVASIASVWAAAIAGLVAGFASGGVFTVCFSAAREIAHAEYAPLAVSCINSLQQFAGFIFPPIFSRTVLTLGFSSAWFLSGLYIFPFTATVLLTKLKG